MKSAFQNWSDVRVFLEVLGAGSTLAASKSLGMSQPTVARRIEALEHCLGLTLFERGTRGFKPTNDALKLAPDAIAIASAAEALAKSAETLRRGVGNPIRLTAAPESFTANLAAILSEFTALHPGTRFDFAPGHRQLDLAAGEADVAIRHCRTVADTTLICRKISTVGWSLCAAQRYVDSLGCPRSPEDFPGHHFAVFESQTDPQSANVWLRSLIEPSQIATTCGDIATMMTAVQSGLGIGIVPTSMLHGCQDIVTCMTPPDYTMMPSWLLVSPEAHKRAIVREFTAFFAPRYQALVKSQKR